MTPPSRRTVLVAGLAAAAPLVGCSASGEDQPGSTATSGAATSAAPAASAPGPSPTSTGPSATTTGPSATSTGHSATASRSSAAAGVPTGADITHGPRTGQGVALTFHGAGDQAILKGMLAVLREHDAAVTVLAIGQWLAAEPGQAGQILDGGHELGNHTWSHRTMPRLSAADTLTEISRAAAELRTLTGSPGRWFRPSGTPASTATIRSAAAKAGYGACLGYDVDPLDYTDPGAPTIVRNVAAALRPGSIVSLHLGHAGTLTAMPQILQTLQDKGLRAVTVSQLLGVR